LNLGVNLARTERDSWWECDG